MRYFMISSIKSSFYELRIIGLSSTNAEIHGNTNSLNELFTNLNASNAFLYYCCNEKIKT